MSDPRHAQVIPDAPVMGARRRWRLALSTVLPVVMIAVTLTATSTVPASAAPCDAGGNKISCENSKPGTGPEVWDISGSGDLSIQGFATDISVNVGGTVTFKIDTDAADYDIDIYRSGWYGGDGARLIDSVQPSATLPQIQPECITELATEFYDCGTWGVSASWAVPSTAVSGVYFALLHRNDTGGESHIMFVVRDDSSTSAVLFQTSDPTWHAYNSYGGSDFYQGGANNRAYKISYNRPFNTRDGVTRRDFYFSSEFAQVRFMERNGYDVTYASGVDTDRYGAHLLNHKVFLSVGHDEYWSAAQRKNIEAARDAGVNLQFLTGNEGYWHTRYEPAASADATAYRTLVSYKETWNNAKIDPAGEWTGTWRDPRYASQAQGAGLPENALTGTLYMVNHGDLPVTVTAAEGKTRLWRNTSLTSLTAGTQAALAPHTVGYESNEDLDNGFRPEGLIRLSTTAGEAPEYLQDFGNTVSAGSTTHHLTLYKAKSGALVFSAGSVQWAWGLDETHDGAGAPADPRMQQAQVNLLADMGAQPTTLMSGLVAATASADKTSPTLTITSPTAGATVPNGSSVTVSGTASDVGGVVAGVEVSTDGGTTWHAATGTTTWSYTYHQRGSGTQVIRARAIDDSANYPATPKTVSLTVPGPYSVFGEQVPGTVDSQDGSSVELGLRFSPQVSGFVSGVRFYKSAANTGSHAGSLWDAAGTRLATVSFSAESASGWQTAYFSSAIPVAAGQDYVVSYTAPTGHYSVDTYYWPYVSKASPPLTVKSGFGSQDPGVFGTAGQFPTESYKLSNYYVDAVFDTVNTTPLAAISHWPQPGATDVVSSTTVSAQFSNDVDPASVGLSVTVTGTGASVGGAVRFDAATRTVVFTPTAQLAAETNFTATLAATSAIGGPLVSGKTWNFTTAEATEVVVCPCSLFSAGAVPAVVAVNDSSTVTLGVRFTPRTTGAITGIRFYKSGANTGTHTGSLWTASGTELATATFVNESASGWQTVYFAQPVQVQAGTEYVASYRTTVGYYSATLGAFAGAGFTRGPLSVGNSAGAYTYGTGFPSTPSTSNYFVDVVFVTDATGGLPESVVSTSPVSGQTDVAVGAVVSATLTGGNGVTPQIAVSSPAGPVAGTTAWNATARQLTFTPAAPLTAMTAHTAVVSVGGTPVVGGTWTFTTAAGPVTGSFSLHGTDSPQGLATDDRSAVELGTAFSVTQAGSVTGIRFYKGTGNDGTHVGTLWSDAGVALATVTFTGESASGWQTATLASPVALTPSTRYVVSYLAPQGNYSYTSGYFTTPRANGPIVAANAPNGLFRYGSSGGFPSESWNATSYFVDVVFTTADGVTPVVPPVTPPVTPPVDPPVTPTDPPVTPTEPPVTPTEPPVTPTEPPVTPTEPPVTPTEPPVTPTDPLTLFPTDAAPQNAEWNDPYPVQVGTRFTTSTPGRVTGIRFYKGPTNTGTHIGYLWSADGTRLAEVTFTAETASGWQTASLSTPVDLVAGQEYRVGLHSTTGNYAVDLNGLATPLTSGPLSAIGGAFIYSQDFPVATSAHNFWVDVTFAPTP